MHRTPSKVVLPNLSENLQKYKQTKNCQGAGSTNSGAYYSVADSACGLDSSASLPVSTQLWAWPCNLCIEPKSCYTKYE